MNLEKKDYWDFMKFNKTEKKKCKFYEHGKCLNSKRYGQDCRAVTTDATQPQKIKDCMYFALKEIGRF